MNSKVVNSWWYNTPDGYCIGIVETFDNITKKTKFRIGVGDGLDEKLDEQKIKNIGPQFYPEVFNGR